MNKLPASYRELFNRSEDFTDIILPGEEEIMRHFRLNDEYGNLNSSLMYIVDYVHKRYLAISPRYHHIIGYDTEYIKDAGPIFYTGLWHRNDFKLMNEQIFPDQMSLLKDYPIAQHKDLLFTFNYRVKTKKGNYIKFSQRSSYIASAPDGTPLLSLGLVNNITSFKPDNNIVLTIEHKTNGSFSDVQSIFQKNYFPDEKNSILTDREIEILKWICEGWSSQKIAEKLYISLHTVNNHRKNILQKTNAKNVIEVIAYAIRNQIL